MIRKFLLVAVLFAPALLLADSRMLRHPSYSKGKVAFSYLGDIWVANEDGSGATRITDNEAREVFPRFSPDGSMIAFSSNRAGNYDVYVISATGGKPRQLTFHSADDNVVGWTPDGKRILFTSTRAQGAFPTVPTLFEVPIEGGIEQPVPTDWGYSGSYSPDGKKLAFMRHPSVWSRKHYRGQYAADLWVMDVAQNTFTKLGDPEYKGNYLWPMYGRDGEIYFVADRLASEKNIKYAGPEVMKSVNNIWKISDKGGMPVQVTHHTDGNLFFPSISADGRVIVYEDNFGIWKLDTATGKSTEIRVDIKSDAKENEVELVSVRNEAESFHLSPSNKRAAIAAHGEIFTIATDRGEPQRVSETAWREQEPRWSPDGKWIAFVSDRTGRQEVWIGDELGKTQKQLSDVDCDKTALIWSPDSKTLLWSGSDHKLRRVNIPTGSTDVLASSNAGNIASPQFSPDGKFVSYTKPDDQLRTHVWIEELGSGADHMISSSDFQVSSGAKWTADGKRLLVLGGLGIPGIASTARGSTQLYSIALTHLDKNPDDRDVDTEAEAEAAAADTGAGRGGRGTGAAPKVDVSIEWDGIDRRIKKLTSMPGSVLNVVPSPDSRVYAFAAIGSSPANAEGASGFGGPALYTITSDGSRLTRLNPPPPDPSRNAGRGAGGGFFGVSEPQWARDSRSLYFLQAGSLYSIAIPPAADSSADAGPSAGRRGGRAGSTAAAAMTETASPMPRRIDFTVRMLVDRPAERKQVFDEAWRVMRNRFYDPKMHGVNWAAAKDTYEPLLGNIADTEELHNVIMEMIGELNASHTGISGGGTLPGEPARERIQTRFPGFNLQPDASGYYKISYIYRKGPADHDYIKLSPGDFVLAVNGKDLKNNPNYWELYNILPGTKLDFLVNSKPALEGAWTIAIEPITQQAQVDLEYQRWVDEHKEMVAKLSKGKIGYLHIRAMDPPSLQKFQEDLLDNRDKKALIIDERFNGGGGIDQELLEILNQRKEYQRTRSRDSLDVPRPVQAFFGPMAVLQNERSASDAEMFPDGFRALGLGKIIGVPTMGAVIGTGAYGLLDGSTIRTPGAAVFTARGENMENYGVQPDIWADNTPSDFLGGHDRQIEKAVEVLQAEMK
ncbi:MAG TPA: S41 family peptidase [Bryobacteraceae bacterium]|nr:S41 family peptidase [Bryobacteraceae bacterium]